MAPVPNIGQLSLTDGSDNPDREAAPQRASFVFALSLPSSTAELFDQEPTTLPLSSGEGELTTTLKIHGTGPRCYGTGNHGAANSWRSDEQGSVLSDSCPTVWFGAQCAEASRGDTVAVFGCGQVSLLAIAAAWR